MHQYMQVQILFIMICENKDAVIQLMGDNKIKYFTFEALPTSNRVQVANLRESTSDKGDRPILFTQRGSKRQAKVYLDSPHSTSYSAEVSLMSCQCMHLGSYPEFISNLTTEKRDS